MNNLRNDPKNKKSIKFNLLSSFLFKANSILPKKTQNATTKGQNEPPMPFSPPPKPALQPRNSFHKLKAKLPKPKLKQWKSADETKKLAAANASTASQLAQLARDTKNKCFTEMNAELHPSTRWLALNQNNCDSQQMAFEASSKCTNTSGCGPCKRIHFILEHCEKYVNVNAKPELLTLSDDAVSNFMNELAGYSHIGLSKDFRHLQIYHTKKQKKHNAKHNKKKENVDYSNTKSLLKHIYESMAKYDMNMNLKQKHSISKPDIAIQEVKMEEIEAPLKKEDDVLTAVSKLMMQLKTKKDFNETYMKLGLLSKGANGKIFAVKSWKKHDFYAMKEICFKHLSANIMYEILRNWRMVEKLELLGTETDIYVDAHRSTFLIVLHLFKGSMCELLKDTYLKKRRCLTENELKLVLQNGVIDTLKTMHGNGYIHGDIKPENLVYEVAEGCNDDLQDIVTAIVDYDLCTRFDAKCASSGVLSEWRGTLGYSAPEWSPYRRIKSQITPKVDIYSLGLTMLILLCGEQPFLCPTAVKQKLEKEDPSINIKQFVYETMINNGECMISHFLKQLAPKISTDLYDLLQSMLLFDPQHRIDIDRVIHHRWFK
eukprot:66145_1